MDYVNNKLHSLTVPPNASPLHKTPMIKRAESTDTWEGKTISPHQVDHFRELEDLAPLTE